mgnify:CR=1 FL=1
MRVEEKTELENIRSGVVGDGQGVDSRMFGQFSGQFEHAAPIAIRDDSSRRDQLDTDGEAIGTCEELAQCRFLPGALVYAASPRWRRDGH